MSTRTIRAVFEGGVFRPVAPVELPEHSVVEFEPRAVGEPQPDDGLDAVYEVLSRRHHSGRPRALRPAQRASAVTAVFLDTVGLLAIWDRR